MKEDKARGGGGVPNPIDPNLPRWVCQNCRHSLCIVGTDSYADKFNHDSSPRPSGVQQGSSLHGGMGSTSTKMDYSFVVLPKQTTPSSQPIPPRPPPRAEPGKAMEDSFVVLPPAVASIYNSETTTGGGGGGDGTHLSSPTPAPINHLHLNNAEFHSSVNVVTRAFHIATTQTQVEQPLCLECMRVLSDKLDKEVEDVNRDIKAYEACLQRLEGEPLDVLSGADFLREKLKIEEEEHRLEEAIKETEKMCAETNAELEELDIKSKRFDELEERYWHEFNSFQFQLTSHQEERDAILSKTDTQAHLELLKRTNVLNDAFPIWHDGEFGTINNFRLGRLPKIPVEWDEINAAWGQACLLLHTMAQYFRPKFSYHIKILPMGSYPRILDSNNNTYELFGPVNLFWSTRYDKAMTLFLTCLKDFADFLTTKDMENNIPPDNCFKLPYKIENDKVGSYTITQSFNKQENWTKALRLTLCDLKWALYWFVGNTNFQPLSPPVGVSNSGSLAKQKGK